MTRSLSSLTPASKARLINQLQEMAAAVEDLPTVTPCALCDKFHGGHCEQWKAPVPADAQEAGCENWIETVTF